MSGLPYDDSRAFPDLERDYIRRRGRPDFDWLRFPEASPRHRLNRPLSEARDGKMVLDRHVPVAVDRFRRDRVDLVLLVPA